MLLSINQTNFNPIDLNQNKHTMNLLFKAIFTLKITLITGITSIFSQDKYYPYVDTTAIWYVKHEVKLKDSPDGSIFNDETFVGYEKHYFKKDSMVDGIQYYKACVEFMGLDTILTLGFSYEIDSVVYSLESIERKDEALLDYDFRNPLQETINADDYIFSKYESVSDEYPLYEAIGHGLGFTVLVNGFTYYYNGVDILWSINDYHTKELKYLCYERNGDIIHKANSDTDCWPSATSIITTSCDFKISNPVESTQILNVTGYKTLTITNVSGNVIEFEYLNGSQSYTLETADYKTGYYNLTLTNDNTKLNIPIIINNK